MARSTRGLYKRGNTWWMTYRDAIGIQRFESCKTSNKKESEQRLIERRKETMEGNLPTPLIKPLPLDELMQRYLAFVGHQRAVDSKKIHFAHFARVWGNPLIHTLTVEVLDQYRTRRLSENVTPATINREMSTLKHALSKAVEWKLLRKTAREELVAIRKYQEPDGRLRYLSGDAEAERLLQACETWLKPIVQTALHTGMRKGELLGLTWDCVDMTHGFIRLKQTKNGKARALPLNETLWGLFSGLRTHLDVPWVFHDDAGHRWNDVRHGFERACEAAGLTDFHFHDLRHTFASWLIMRGVPLATVSNLLGHTTPTMTLRYAHLSPKHLTSAVRVLDRISSQPQPERADTILLGSRE
ncbi:MAG: site-specific integrase [Nitrospira sp.]|nr:site-specific integrase [Nitrospira sp.]